MPFVNTKIDVEYDTTNAPEELAIAYCCDCGLRVGWYQPWTIDDPTPGIYCERCVAAFANGDREWEPA